MAVVRILLVLCCCFSASVHAGVDLGSLEDSWYVDLFADDYNNDYNPLRSPDYKPVQVELSMFILDYSDFDPKTWDMTFDMYFRTKWEDRRLITRRKRGTVISLSDTGSENFQKYFWTPDVFFPTAKEVKPFTGPYNTFLKVDSRTGTVLLSRSLRVRTTCSGSITSFPLGPLSCVLDIESYGHSTTDVTFPVKDKSQFGITNTLPSIPPTVIFQELDYKNTTAVLTTGAYDRTQVILKFTSSINYYMRELYIPSTCFLFITYLSFFVGSKELTARFLTGILMLLATSSLSVTVRKDYPQTDKATAADIWIGTILTFMFVYLLEIVFVFRLADEGSTDELHGVQGILKKSARAADGIFAIAFPVVFIVFAIVYFAVFMS